MHWTSWIFRILGALTTGFGAVLLCIRLLALRRWTRVHGQVIDACVAGPDSSRSYSANVTILWNAGGRDYSKTFDDWASDEPRAYFEKIIERYPKGSTAPILYNPDDPSRAYLQPDNKLHFVLVPAIVIFLGLVIAGIGYST